MSQTTPTPPAGGSPSLSVELGGPTRPGSDEDELDRLRHEITGLRAALASRATIDQARGILIARYRITPEQAFQVLVRWSQHRNIKLRVIAEALVQLCQDGPEPLAVEPALRVWLEQEFGGPAERPQAEGDQ